MKRFVSFGLMSILGVSSLEAGDIEFNRDIRPILSDKCFHCHGPDKEKREAKLRLDTRKGALKFDAIVPGDLEESELVYRIETDDEEDRMPPEESHLSLSKEEIGTLKQWIKEGAEYQGHWSFESPKRTTAKAIRTIIDEGVATRLKDEGLKRSPRATREALIRRLSLDLRGLPPTLGELDAFLADESATVWESLVDRMLASPQCAERLALDWLDVARYADTNGYSIDDHRDMWAWRDWVVHSFLQNKPYDQFIVEQLAGDLIPGATPEQKMATGFLRNSMNTHEGGTIPDEYRVAYIADKIDTVSSAFMGLTMKCAQCHDHKYDPISQKDYYRFFAFFNSATEKGHGATNGNTAPVLKVTSPLHEQSDLAGALAARAARMEQLRDRLNEQDPERFDVWKAEDLAKSPPQSKGSGLAGILRKSPEARSPEEEKELAAAFLQQSAGLIKRLERALSIELGIVKKQAKAGGQTDVMVMDSPGNRKTHILVRGEYNKPGEEVTAGVPEMFPQLPDGVPADRLALARWLTSATHPLTARVAVNRYWQMIFGAGLVRTAEDFGSQGEWPSHPQLLDDLAVSFREGGWNVQHLLKEIVLSETYRQRSDLSAAVLEADPGNRLLARAPRVRLSAELIRDNAFAISGLLNQKLGGPSVYPEQPDGLWKQVSHFGHGAFTAQAYFPDAGERALRRSMYTFWKRTSPPPAMAIFDAPTREICTVRRLATNTPLQALVLLNDPQFLKAARALARRMVAEGGGTPASRIGYGFRLATARPPVAAELDLLAAAHARELARFTRDPNAARDLLLAPEESGPNAELAAYTMAASTILNLNETITKQ